MNTADEGHILFREDSAPVSLQDKEGDLRLSAPSDQPSTAEIPALHIAKNEPAVEHEPSSAKKPHSTKRQTVFAGFWIDHDTDSYIQDRQRHTRDSQGKRFTRSKIIALMLRERAQDDTFQRSQAILMPMIQETMRQEFRIFENRFLAIIAKIAYQVGWILLLLQKFVGIVLRKNEATLHSIEVDSETAARVNVTRRTPQIDEVKERLSQALDAKS
jgi:hypothetical protein